MVEKGIASGATVPYDVFHQYSYKRQLGKDAVLNTFWLPGELSVHGDSRRCDAAKLHDSEFSNVK